MAQNDLQTAIALVHVKLSEVAELPTVEEIANGQLAFETGLFLVEFQEVYEYATHQPTHPTNSLARLGYVAQYTYRDLDKFTDSSFMGLPIQALSSVSGAIRAKIEASNDDGSWQAQEPGMDVIYTQTTMLFADKAGVEIAMLGFNLELRGFNVA